MMHTRLFNIVLLALLLISPTNAEEAILEVEADIDGEYTTEHASSRLARLQARQKASRHVEDPKSLNTTSIKAKAPEKRSTSSGEFNGDIPLLQSLGSIASQVPIPAHKRIAVGWNANVDMIVSGCDLVRRDFPTPNPRDVEKITSLADFADSFAYWFEKGAAAERFVETAELFQDIIELVQSQSQNAEYKTGGNAALMSTALAGESCQCDVLLGGLVGPQLRSLLSSSIRTVVEHTENDEDNSDGARAADAIHLIMEYSRGEQWGELTSPRHNRFIVVHDEYNANIKGLEGLSAQMKETESFDAFIASGLNQLEGLPSATRDARLSVVAAHLHALPADTPVHFELASMANPDFLLHMFQTLVVHSDSLGLNEEELTMLYEVLGGEFANKADMEAEEELDTSISRSFTRDMLTGRVPSPRAVSLALQFVLDAVDRLHSTAEEGEHPLRLVSRIHFHCLSFHIISVREEVSGTPIWSSSMDTAVSRGALAAASQACVLPVEQLSESSSLVEILAPKSFSTPTGKEVHITENSAVATWSNGGHIFYLAPVPVCKKPKNTVGLGDAISANALAYSLL